MKISVRKSSIVIEGYVNAVDRYSRELYDKSMGSFVERVLPGVFKRALAKRKNVKVLLNHDYDRELANTVAGTAKLYEDNVGLRAVVEISDPEVIADARKGKLVGWSFGFEALDDEQEVDTITKVMKRTIKALNLKEVSIINDQLLPAYVGTSIEARTVDGKTVEIRAELGGVEVVDEEKDKEKSEKPADGVASETNPVDQTITEEELKRQHDIRTIAINS